MPNDASEAGNTVSSKVGCTFAAGDAPVHSHVNPGWWKSGNERALLPHEGIVDAHHHLWQAENPLHGMRYSLADLFEDALGGHRVLATVFVEGQAMHRKIGPQELAPVGETEFVLSSLGACNGDLCRSINPCAAIVARADLLLGDQVGRVLEAQLEAGQGRLRGIRQVTAWHEDPAVKGTVLRLRPEIMQSGQFRRGFSALHKHGLSFDAWLYFTQMDELVSLADAFPAVPIIIDHVGGYIGTGRYGTCPSETFEAWRRKLAAAALRPNVYVKLSGLGMRVSGFRFNEQATPPIHGELTQAWRPFFEVCIDLFGPQRCMFASNFPVDKASCGWNALWNAYKSIASRYSSSERARLLRDTAQQVYRIA